MSETDELLDIIDSEDKVIAQATRGEAYKKGLLHRAVNIFITNSDKKILLQQRSSKKLKFPLFWDLSVGEHVKPGEDYIQAAKRGLKEELNIKTRLKVIRDLHHQQT